MRTAARSVIAPSPPLRTAAAPARRRYRRSSRLPSATAPRMPPPQRCYNPTLRRPPTPLYTHARASRAGGVTMCTAGHRAVALTLDLLTSHPTCSPPVQVGLFSFMLLEDKHGLRPATICSNYAHIIMGPPYDV